MESFLKDGDRFAFLVVGKRRERERERERERFDVV